MSDLKMSNTTTGVVYLIFGIFGLGENTLTALLMATHQEMRNPTYIYMINLCVCDACTLISIGIYSGVVLIRPSWNIPTVSRISAFVTASSWCSACTFIILMTISRYVQLKSSHKMSDYFKKRNLILTVLLPWTVPALCYGWILYYDKTPFKFYVEKYSWHFDENTLGQCMLILHMILIVFVSLTVNCLNISTLMHVHKTRNQLRTLESSSNGLRELKLFLQCAITGSLFTVAAVTFFVVSKLQDRMNSIAFIVSHFMWILNALQYPLIYFCLNSMLREYFVKIFSTKSCNTSGNNQKNTQMWVVRTIRRIETPV